MNRSTFPFTLTFAVVAFSSVLALSSSGHAETIEAVFLPHGPADPPNPAWSQTAYRDIP